MVVIQYFVWGKKQSKFIAAKFLGLLAMPIITVILFYGYTSFWHHSLSADVAVFIASVAGGQLVSLFILRKGKVWPGFTRVIGTTGLAILTIAFPTLRYSSTLIQKPLMPFFAIFAIPLKTGFSMAGRIDHGCELVLYSRDEIPR